ncbi:hypothetical protein OX283_002875 [Flavobacterium sp. SUN052]|uniref:hypothetical protein n=1 Tax=Flavobacterium sp. SUN052 TaxID=3002441 RepID=UPI00237D9D86|nr:hypothetical protein [Flavobacterium sp. SUN052]MEC4003590.1 hypothetical protein [Flavobacterium sp. SUN052]
MKNISILLTVIFAFMSCNCQKKAVDQSSLTSNVSSVNQQAKLPKLEYEANTRGFYQKIIIENQEMIVSNDRNSSEKGTAVKISDSDFKELISAFQTVNLADLATYKDPTQKRFHDGAAIAHLKIVADEKEYQTTDFDHGFPPVEIEKLVNKIVLLGKKE